jgi:uroporphyrinogen decarboxylase
MWADHFAPRVRRWSELGRKYGVRLFYHSDGGIHPLIPGLIEAGVDVLNPVQHNCPGMKLEGLKRDFGDQLIFHGAVDTQKILPFGTPQEVRAETEACARILGAGGTGYICGSCHNIQAGTPVENILSMIEAVKGFRFD